MSVAMQAGDAALSAGAVHHLLAQVSFLHREVERLEAQLATQRARVAEARARTTCERAAATSPLRASASDEGSKAGLQRCQALERQLAAAHAERAALSHEMAALKAQLRVARAARTRRDVSCCDRATQCACATPPTERAEDGVVADEHVATARPPDNVRTRRDDAAVQTSDEAAARCGAACAVQVAAATSECGVQTHMCDGSHEGGDVADGCSVMASCAGVSAAAAAAHAGDSTHALSRALEAKMRECDSLRGRLDELATAHDDALGQLDAARAHVRDATSRLSCAGEDVERLSLQVHVLQLRTSELAATERDLVDKVAMLEEARAAAHDALAARDREQSAWREQAQQYERDVAQLVQNKNYANEQLASLARELEDARAQLQVAQQREAQQTLSLRGKNDELHALHTVYQASVREGDELRRRQQHTASELDAARSELAANEERVLLLQAQRDELHGREQQLALDVQTLEHECAQLHRRLLQSDATAAEWERRWRDAQQAQTAVQHMNDELRQHVAELSKQLVVHDHECDMLRRRCTAAEDDAVSLRANLTSVQEQYSVLTDAHARMTAQQLLSAVNASATSSRSDVVTEHDAHHCERVVHELRTHVADERARRAHVERELAAVRGALDDAVQANERLQQLLVSQTATLSHLSQ